MVEGLSRGERKGLTFLSVTLLKDKAFKRHIAINPIELILYR